MTQISHLKSLQALDVTIREGSLKLAADRLGITPAAVGQRIRALEDYLSTDLLTRGRSGLAPTADLAPALADLRLAFDALQRVTDALDFQRVSEIHIVADGDWAELWLLPRLPAFQQDNPNIRFCVNGAGDVPVRLGAPDLRITCGEDQGEPLYRDLLVPVTGPDNPRRLSDWDPVLQMEGMPLLHLKAQREGRDAPGWVEWFARYGHRNTGQDRGVHYPRARIALEAVRQNIGFLVCGLSLVLQDLDAGTIVLPFPVSDHLVAPHPYRLRISTAAAGRPQIQRFAAWLWAETMATRSRIDAIART
jgi:LysR family transcriptional regulator, glycine cleavage system transcriptional activator